MTLKHLAIQLYVFEVLEEVTAVLTDSKQFPLFLEHLKIRDHVSL